MAFNLGSKFDKCYGDLHILVLTCVSFHLKVLMSLR